ncbi:MAG TPA: hypothetical protein VGC77_05745 [Rhodopseudomonas sp.]|uniref:P-loop ATPase, Sll1717 family n=1 Tax=Rhodopseudomonas sp. TaxID=1078 RepID=UPI002ED8EFA5
MPLRDFLTPEEPLGPIRHERILRRRSFGQHDEDPVNLLIYQAEPFDVALHDLHPIILGRRGAGKTAIVAAMLAGAARNHYFYARDEAINDHHDIYVFIQSWDHLDEIVNLVGIDCYHSLGSQPMWDDLLPETAARFWARHLWQAIFNQIFRDASSETNSIDYRAKLPLVFKFIEGRDIIDPRECISDESLQRAFEQTRDSVLKYLAASGRRCYIIIDSLDLYPITSPRFSRILSGLLRCITNFSDSYDRVRIFCCVPAEVERHLFTHVANEIRDMSPTTSYSRLQWRPIDLLKIVAERFREFLRIHLPGSPNDQEFLAHISRLDFSQRENLRLFYEAVMPKYVTNRFGQREDSVAYLVRHSQLLPRELILLFGRAISISHLETRVWNLITAEAIVRAVEESESALARQILKPYLPIYRELIAACEDVLSELPPICTLSDLHSIGRRMRKSVAAETDNPWKSLYEIGVIGYIDAEQSNRKTQYYEYGLFHYNAPNQIKFANHLKYCVHPLFSGAWHLKRTPNMKFIYPSRIDESFWS